MNSEHNVVLIIYILTSIVLSGCTGAIIKTFQDDNTNSQISRMNGNILAGGISRVELNAQRFIKGSVPSISLIVIYSGPIFINIDEGKTLILTIDNQLFELTGQGSENNRTIISLGLIEEKAYYHNVEPNLIRMLAHATEVDVEILGSRKMITRYFNKGNFTVFKEFYDTYVITQVH